VPGRLNATRATGPTVTFANRNHKADAREFGHMRLGMLNIQEMGIGRFAPRPEI